MKRRMVIMLVAVAVVLGAVFGFQVFKGIMIKKFMATLSNPPQTVATAKAGYSQWQPTIEAIGSLRAVKGADLSLEVSGVVDSISFNSGDDVAEGAPLLKLRSDDDAAKLDSLKATAELNQITYDRDQKQFKLQAVSQATLDTDSANLKNANAQVARNITFHHIDGTGFNAGKPIHAALLQLVVGRKNVVDLDDDAAETADFLRRPHRAALG